MDPASARVRKKKRRNNRLRKRLSGKICDQYDEGARDGKFERVRKGQASVRVVRERRCEHTLDEEAENSAGVG